MILPPHLKAAQKVDNYEEIMIEAIEICKGMQNGSFVTFGSKYNDCFAIAQPQVSHKPLRYFVINPLLGAPIAKELGGLLIINPRLLSKDKESKIMSSEGCMSYPLRPEKKVKRFNRITVTYDVIKDLKNPKLITMDKIGEKELTGLSSIVMQHELQHLNGKSIWHE